MSDNSIGYAPLTEKQLYDLAIKKKRELVATSGLKWTSESAGDYGIGLLKIISYLQGLDMNYFDDRVSQNFLIYSVDNEAVHAGCRELGYKIRDNIASIVKINVTTTAATTIPSGAKVVKKLTSGNSIYFETLSDLVFTMADTKSVYALQGETKNQMTTGDDTEYQKVILTNYPINYGSIVVYVDGSAWTQVTDLVNSGPDDHHYTVEYDFNAQPTIWFGDGVYGDKPANGANIAVVYRICDGAQGNIAPGEMSFVSSYAKVSGVTNAAPAVGYLKTAITANSSEVELEDDNSINSFLTSGVAYIDEDSFTYTGISGNKFTGVSGLERSHAVGEEVLYSDSYVLGVDRETNKEAKVSAIRNNRIKNSALSLPDYEYLTRQIPGVARAKAVIDHNLVTIQIVPVDADFPPQTLVTTVYSYLTNRKNARHTIRITNPNYVHVDVTVDVYPASSYSYVSEVKPKILEAIQDFLHPLNTTSDGVYYINSWGMTLRKSQLFSNLMALENGSLIYDMKITEFKRSITMATSTGVETMNVELEPTEIAHVGKITVNILGLELEPGVGVGEAGIYTVPKIVGAMS